MIPPDLDLILKNRVLGELGLLHANDSLNISRATEIMDGIEKWAKDAVLAKFGLLDENGQIMLGRAFVVIDGKMDMHPPDWCPLVFYEFAWEDYFDQEERCTEEEYLKNVWNVWKERYKRAQEKAEMKPE